MCYVLKVFDVGKKEGVSRAAQRGSHRMPLGQAVPESFDFLVDSRFCLFSLESKADTHTKSENLGSPVFVR